MKFVSRAKLIELIKATNGGIFSVLYTAVRSDGHVRRLNCRLGVTKHLTGTGKAAPESAKVITVYDIAKKNYRSLGLEGLLQATIANEVYEVKE